MDEHRIPLEELLQRYKCDPKVGLKTKYAEQLNLEIGDNALPEKKGKNPIIVYLEELFFNWFNIMMWFSAGLCFLVFGLTPSD